MLGGSNVPRASLMLGSRGRLRLVLNRVRPKKIEGHLVSPRIAARGVLSPGEIRGPVLACEQLGATGRSEFDFPTSGLAEFLPDAPLRPDGLGRLSQTRHPQAKWPRMLGADSAGGTLQGGAPSGLDSRVNIPPRELNTCWPGRQRKRFLEQGGVFKARTSNTC